MLLLFLVFAGLYYAKSFLISLFIGGILATLFLHFCNWMEKKKTPKELAVFDNVKFRIRYQGIERKHKSGQTQFFVERLFQQEGKSRSQEKGRLGKTRRRKEKNKFK
jgi:hypothetical protein